MYNSISPPLPSNLDEERALSHETAALHAVLVVRLDVPQLKELVQHTLSVLHRPVSVDSRVNINILCLFHLLLVHPFQEILPEVPLPWFPVSPLVCRTQSVRIKPFIKDRSWACQTKTYSGRSLRNPGVGWNLMILHQTLSNQKLNKVLGTVTLCISFTCRVSGGNIVKSWHTELTEKPLSVLIPSRTDLVHRLNFLVGSFKQNKIASKFTFQEFRFCHI